ncbi:hypothetical protein VTK56DRAFT_3953 [Thermocarpiscus australiensis]
MKQRRLLRFHGLKRPKVRQTWNKYNLYNLARLRTPFLGTKTFFQQKWIAKSLTRGYHGEHIKEYKWERMFSRRPLSAVNMDPAYMALHDGSEQAAGRGSGLQQRPSARSKRALLPIPRGPRNRGNLNEPTPYMQMTFAPMERRLDIAIFRALFASSARQARQFVLHGAVTVNGKKMRHPGYLLNPGDMFQVDIERVMTATGKPKRPQQQEKAASASGESEPAEEEADAEEAAAEEDEEAAEGENDGESAKDKQLALLQQIRERAKAFLAAPSSNLRAKEKRSLRILLKEAKDVINRSRRAGDESIAEMQGVEAELSAMLSGLKLTPAQRKEREKQEALEQERQEAAAKGELTAEMLTDQERTILARLLRKERQNPHDPSKPYATPWRPRDWMAPFAFIPRYLEVNQRICAAVYLRHPVARPGRSEVPSPFSLKMSQLAFNWYLRRS